MNDPVIRHEGDLWRILSTGAFKNGAVYCHLASTTQFVAQANGECPKQMGDYLDAEIVEKAFHRPRGFYSWNRSLRGAFERGERDYANGAYLSDCPYRDKRTSSNRLTFSRMYQNAWFDGWNHRQLLSATGAV